MYFVQERGYSNSLTPAHTTNGSRVGEICQEADVWKVIDLVIWSYDDV